MQAQIQEKTGSGQVTKILELVGGSTLLDSLSLLGDGGVCCMAGLLGGSVSVPDFKPLFALPIGRYLTAYGERSFMPSNLPLDELVPQVIDGSLHISVAKVFELENIVQAPDLMKSNQSKGEVVVVVDQKQQ